MNKNLTLNLLFADTQTLTEHCTVCVCTPLQRARFMYIHVYSVVLSMCFNVCVLDHVFLWLGDNLLVQRHQWDISYPPAVCVRLRLSLLQ